MFRITSEEEPAPSPNELNPAGRQFLARCFVKRPGGRATAAQLAKHKFVDGTSEHESISQEGMIGAMDSGSIANPGGVWATQLPTEIVKRLKPKGDDR